MASSVKPRLVHFATALLALAMWTGGCGPNPGGAPDGGASTTDGGTNPTDGGHLADEGYPHGDASYGDQDTEYGDQGTGYQDQGTVYQDQGTVAPTDPFASGCEGDVYTGYEDEFGAVDPWTADALLFSRHGGFPLWDWCNCRPDDAVLPRDPRTLVSSSENEGRAVAFNVTWRNCHEDPAAIREVGAAQTCGELRARVARGQTLQTPGSPGGGALFVGTNPDDINALFGIATFDVSSYRNMSAAWGSVFFGRPDNYDTLVAERYGSVFGDAPNPYPLAGEDPNAPGVNGGSGRLPQFFTHLRTADGEWTNKIGITCNGCHSGAVTGPSGPGFMPGSGSPLADHNLFLRDMTLQGYLASAVTIINLNRTRGVNNASDVNLAVLFPEDGFHDLETYAGLLLSGSTAGMDTPAWWNMGHRPAKFVDGLFPMDAPRVDMVFYTPITGLFGDLLGPVSASAQDWMRANGPPANDWATVLKAPRYPGEINEALAEQGAVLFHELDMWAPERNNPVRRPAEGNGSCASCHGAYAPRYTNDPAFLATPELEGVAGYITPIDIIGTDRVRLDANSEAVQVAGAANFFGYPETTGTDNDCGLQNRADLRGDRELGYLAPPLYGAWATAPYLHNGSVPNLWELLEPQDRHDLWRRRSSPTQYDETPLAPQPLVMGYDTNFDRAYDQAKVGWDYDVVACRNPTFLQPFVSPHLACDDGLQALINDALEVLYDNVILAWNLLYPVPVTREDIENRKVYNTLMYAQSNAGHEFNAVLTDAERRAIIEYLKTL